MVNGTVCRSFQQNCAIGTLTPLHSDFAIVRLCIRDELADAARPTRRSRCRCFGARSDLSARGRGGRCQRTQVSAALDSARGAEFDVAPHEPRTPDRLMRTPADPLGRAVSIRSRAASATPSRARQLDRWRRRHRRRRRRRGTTERLGHRQMPLHHRDRASRRPSAAPARRRSPHNSASASDRLLVRLDLGLLESHVERSSRMPAARAGRASPAAAAAAPAAAAEPRRRPRRRPPAGQAACGRQSACWRSCGRAGFCDICSASWLD